MGVIRRQPTATYDVRRTKETETATSQREQYLHHFFAFNVPVDIDYDTLADEIENGTLRQRLEEELLAGFRQLQSQGDPLPPASYFASKVAEIIDSGATEPLTEAMKYGLYQEVLTACEQARATVLGEPPVIQ